MTLRKRLSLIAAASVGIAVLLAVAGCYMLVRHQLRSQVDNSLRAQANAVINQGGIALERVSADPPEIMAGDRYTPAMTVTVGLAFWLPLA